MCLPPNNFIGKNARVLNFSPSQPSIQIDSNFLAKLLQSQSTSTSPTVSDTIVTGVPANTAAQTEDFAEATIDEDEDNNKQESREDGGALLEDAQNPELIEAIRDQEPVGNSHDAAVCCNKCRESRVRFEHMMVRKLNEVLEVVRGMNPGVLENRQRGNYTLLLPMPFRNIEELSRFDRDLQENEEMRRQFVRNIEEIGGKNIQKVVKFAMEAVMADELTQQVVWTLGAENIPKISKYRFPYLIIDVARNTFDGTKKTAVEDRIAEWLRRGGDRMKAAMVAANKRRERREQEEPNF